MKKYLAMAVIFGLQYMKDSYVAAVSASDVDGWIVGIRATCEF